MAGAAGLRHRLSQWGAVAEDGFALGETALVAAALDRVGGGGRGAAAQPEDYLGHLDDLAAELAARLDRDTADAGQLAAGLAEVMARRHRYRGDDRDDDDLSNANLMTVIDTRRGVGAALGILYVEAARRAGWQAEWLAFPAAVLLRLADAGGGRVLIDPLACGRSVDVPAMRALLKASAGVAAELEPGHHQPLADRDILLRLHGESKLRLLRLGRIDRALAVVEIMLLYAPDRAALWREAGMMYLRLDNPAAAVAALEQFCRRTSNGQARGRALALLAEIRSRPH